MEGHRDILGPLDTANLQSHGLLHPSESSGSQRIYKSCLSYVQNEYNGLPLNVNIAPSATAASFATIPRKLISHDALIYMGISGQKAAELWNEWTHWPSTGPVREVDTDDGGVQVTFIEFIIGHLEKNQDACTDDDEEWKQCLAACGVSDSLKEAIMDPDFKNIRLSNSCIFWLRDTIEARYKGLELINWRSQQREKELARATEESL